MFFNAKKYFFDAKIILLLKRFFYSLFVAECCRLFFCIYHYNTFSFGLQDLFLVLLNGLRFDVAAICVLLIPFFLFQLWPLNFIQLKIEKALKIYWFISISCFVLLNLIDTAYFVFSGKRSNADFFSINSNGGGDFLSQAPKYILDYWYWWILFFIFSYFVWKKYPRYFGEQEKKSTLVKSISVTLVSILFIFIAIRGGIQGRPIKSIAASEFVEPKYSAAVLNTAFTIITTIGEENIETPKFFVGGQEEKIWPMLHKSSNSNSPFLNKNIVIIVAESLGKEWMGYFGAQKTSTPFLDSLCKHSFVCTNAYANAQRSIEGIPAIFSSTPGLSEEAFVTSSYGGTTQLTSLANTLDKFNYHSAFFHGGNNGTMAFDWYFKLIDFKEYYGRKEFANPKIFDGFWGVPDYEFLEFSENKISQFKQPFIAGIFTLSSHHPFKVPKKFAAKKGYSDYQKSLLYADFSIQNFFEKAKKENWFNQTIFVITADHTSISEKPFYSNSVGDFAIPIIFYSPGFIKAQHYMLPCQQIDIIPSLLGLINYPQAFISSGSDIFNEKKSGAFMLVNNNYQYVGEKSIVQFNNEKLIASFLVTDSLMINNDKRNVDEKEYNLAKAFVQNYFTRLNKNKLK
jgi:phosphoglycerol transferase MdoB-like AlkP superfamily enzyme